MSSGLLFFFALFHVAFTSGSYEEFRRKHGRDAIGQGDAVSYEARHNLFRRRTTEALLHNAYNASWKMAINHYSDYTDAELRAKLGYKRVGGRWNSPRVVSAGTTSLIEEHEQDTTDYSKLASEVDYRQSLQKSATWVRNQGACGSCWAVAATGALEMHAEKLQGAGKSKRLSYTHLVECVPNPQHCGGTGGCQGATAELAFEYVRTHGISSEEDFKNDCAKSPSALQVADFVRLPENKASPLKAALSEKGPVVVSVDGSSWYGYSSGVFSGCEKDTVVNHAVLATGYGKDPISQKDYWTIRNSWGPDWGEKGYMRLERHMNDDDYCGVDNAPQDGVYCTGAPDSVPVCGMCGITSDSAYPNVVSSLQSVSPHGNMRAKAKTLS